MSVDGNLWYVKLADGDVERVTLDELDVAFQSGQINETSMVLAAGSDKWMKLSELLGASDDPSEDATDPGPRSTQAPSPAQAHPPMQAVAPQGAPGTGTQAMTSPVAMRVAPHGAPAPSPAPVRVALPAAPPMARSLRPISIDLSETGDVPFRRSSKKRLVVGMLGTVAALGVVAFVVVRQRSASAAADPMPSFAAAAAVMPAPEPVAQKPAETAAPTPPTGTPQAAIGSRSPVMDPTQQQPLSEDQRVRLAENDKKMKSKAKGHPAGGGTASSHSSSKDKSTSFTTGGNKFDPLNASF
jgi:hypothetical protein